MVYPVFYSVSYPDIYSDTNIPFIPTKTKASPERLACCVDYTGKFSNFFEDLLKLDKFAESIEEEFGVDCCM